MSEANRPAFPKRAVITAGMPYGNKELHFGHIGGVFVHADFFARFLRDRLGKENVIFVSGTDCYGSPISENFRKLRESGEFEGEITDFISKNHRAQKQTLGDYEIALNLFAASGLDEAKEIHAALSREVIEKLYAQGYLTKTVTSQFYDPDFEVLLNGRQVVGKCPIEGCQSEKGYADECDLGHQYMPRDLLFPKSTLSGKKPEMRDVANWYFNLEDFDGKLREWVALLEQNPNTRPLLTKTLAEFLRPPVIHIKKDQLELLRETPQYAALPEHELLEEENKPSAILTFHSLKDREQACNLLAEAGVRFRTGKALVPFRLTGNTEWGVPAPTLDGLSDQTFWVWPESLWAPISFTKTYLAQHGAQADEWKNWWCDRDAGIFQFIGQDNIYFYGLAEPALFMALQGKQSTAQPENGALQLPTLVANNHLLFLDKKASSSGTVKPPMAADLLAYYTPDQLRAHFLGLGLGIRSVSFQPKPLNPKAQERDSDPVLKEGNLLTNVFNRIIRSCFYTAQQYYDGKIPVGTVSETVLQEAEEAICEYERLTMKFEFHNVMNLLDNYIRGANKYWSKYMKEADAAQDSALRTQTLIDCFHMVRIASILTHPVAPKGTEMLLHYLQLGESERFFSWEHILQPVYFFMDDPATHQPLFLEPRVDFFEKHPSQLVQP